MQSRDALDESHLLTLRLPFTRIDESPEADEAGKGGVRIGGAGNKKAGGECCK